MVDDHNCGTSGKTRMTADGTKRFMDFVDANFNFPVARYALEFGDFSNGNDTNQTASLAREMEHIDYLGKSLNKLVIASLWIEPSLNQNGADGAPTNATDASLTALGSICQNPSLDDDWPQRKPPR